MRASSGGALKVWGFFSKAFKNGAKGSEGVVGHRLDLVLRCLSGERHHVSFIITPPADSAKLTQHKEFIYPVFLQDSGYPQVVGT